MDRIHVGLDDTTLERLDHKRGDIPRSAYVRRLVEKDVNDPFTQTEVPARTTPRQPEPGPPTPVVATPPPVGQAIPDPPLHRHRRQPGGGDYCADCGTVLPHRGV